MVRSSRRAAGRGISAFVVVVQLATLAAAQTAPAGAAGGTTSSSLCNWDNLCPEKSPCCSDGGFCGSGTYCLTGCNPLGSFESKYCAPMPLCQSNNYTFTDTSKILMNASAANGDVSQFDWTADKIDNKNTGLIKDGGLLLSLTESGGGTKLSSTRAVYYADITASIKVTGKVGVVTAFITMSGVKDEIDWEWTGTNADEGQTNYFWEGDVADYTHGSSVAAKGSDTQFITYGISWGEDQLVWSVNGKTVRTLTKASTLEDGLYKYPQTPSRIQMSVWPAGTSASAQGVIDWAGGLINWQDPDYVSQGYFGAEIQWINVACHDPSLSVSSSNSTSNSTSSRLRMKRDSEVFGVVSAEELWKRQSSNLSSYVYGTNNSAGQIAVSGSDSQTVINSPYSTGINMVVPAGTKSVSNKPNSASSSSSSNWWSKLPLAARIGIIVGAVLLCLMFLVASCTCYAKRGDKARKYAQLSADKAAAAATAAGGPARKPQYADTIALVDKPNLRRDDSYDSSIVGGKGGGAYQHSNVGSNNGYGGYQTNAIPYAAPPPSSPGPGQRQQQQSDYGHQVYGQGHGQYGTPPRYATPPNNAYYVDSPQLGHQGGYAGSQQHYIDPHQQQPSYQGGHGGGGSSYADRYQPSWAR